LSILYAIFPFNCSDPTPYTGQLTNAANSTIYGKAVNEAVWETVFPGKHLRYLKISAGPTLTMEQDWFKERMDFWDSLPLFENEFHVIDPPYFLDLVYNFLIYLMK
jgi:hypothetical protein